MSSAALAVNDERSGATALPADVAQRRLAQRREMLAVQAMSYVLGDIVLWIYALPGRSRSPSPWFSCSAESA